MTSFSVALLCNVSSVLIPVMNRPWLHRFAILLAACTLALFVTGAFVTSNEERPFYSFGQFHFTVVWTVGILAVGLVIWLSLEKTTAWLRGLGWIVLATVAADVVVGIRMNSESPSISASHAFLAQLLFSTTVVIALFTSSGWSRDPQPAEERGRPSLWSLAAMTLVLAFMQVALGVAVRHGIIGVALHILGAFLVVLLMLTLAVIVSRRCPGHPTLRPAAATAATIVSVQAFLGFTILSMQGSRLIDPVAMIVAAAIHTAVGALTLASVVVMALLIRRNRRAAEIGPPD
jgi:heme A synthase